MAAVTLRDRISLLIVQFFFAAFSLGFVLMSSPMFYTPQQTVQEAGWSGRQNGELLKLAESKFIVLGTADTTSVINETWQAARSPLLFCDPPRTV